MAQLPCTMHGARFTGRATHCYPAVLTNGRRRGAHHRLCKSCWEQTLEFVTEQGFVWKPEQIGVPERDFQCAECGLPVSVVDSVLIMTFYAESDERQEAQAYLHDECSDVVARRWSLS